jgi:predicted ATPase
MIGEAARAIIIEGRRAGKSIEEIRGDELFFQNAILARRIAVEANLLASEVIGLDRGMPSSIAYYRVYDFGSRKAIVASFMKRYRRVFVMLPLPIKIDYARTDHAIADRLHSLIIEAYEHAGYSPILVPIFSEDRWENIRERVRFIKERL